MKMAKKLMAINLLGFACCLLVALIYRPYSFSAHDLETVIQQQTKNQEPDLMSGKRLEMKKDSNHLVLFISGIGNGQTKNELGSIKVTPKIDSGKLYIDVLETSAYIKNSQESQAMIPVEELITLASKLENIRITGNELSKLKPKNEIELDRIIWEDKFRIIAKNQDETKFAIAIIFSALFVIGSSASFGLFLRALENKLV